MAPVLCFAFPSSSPSYEGAAAYDSLSVTSKSCGFACQHAQLRSSFGGRKPGSQHSFLPPFKRLNLGIANAYLENAVSRSQIIADGLRSQVDACRFRLVYGDQTLLKVDVGMKNVASHFAKNTQQELIGLKITHEN